VNPLDVTHNACTRPKIPLVTGNTFLAADKLPSSGSS
jgi:hypothetical protein